MADRHVDALLCGGGLAAANCARWLREEGFDGTVALVGREPEPPYNRPPCSKGYLQGKETREDAYSLPPEWYEENSVELLTRTSVLKLDLEDRVAVLSTQEEISFDKALIATGANVRLLRVEGVQLDGIHYLRALGNADTIRADAEQAERVVVIGGSYIATEVAASLTLLGKKVTMLMQESVTHERGFGSQAGHFFQGVLEEHGVEVHGGDELERFEGTDGRVSRVVTKAGKELDCDMVVVGVGVMPDVTLARSAGLELGESGGVRCSSGLETSVPGIFAAGDICEYESPVHRGERMRLEHWDVAFNHGKTAALNMLGKGVEHDVVPYFFSDLADWASFEYVGPGSGELVVRGSMDDGDFSAFFLEKEQGHVVAALSVGRGDDLDHARRFIADRTKPDTGALGDEDTDLGEL
jgi:3-phenylpropionate/trans-cinnamate dioxygenase ferredoxin reductase subunit